MNKRSRFFVAALSLCIAALALPKMTKAQQAISVRAPQSSTVGNCLLVGTWVQQDVWVKNTGSVPISSWIAVRLGVVGDTMQRFTFDTISAGLLPGDSVLVTLPYQVPNWSPYYVWVSASGYGVYDSAFIQECAEREDIEIGFVSPPVGSPNAVTPVKVYLKNNSTTKTYYSVGIAWTINGVVQVGLGYQNPSGIAPLGYDTLTIGMYYSMNCREEIKVWIISQDKYPQNDTAVYIGQGCPPIITQISATICRGDTYQFGKWTLTQAGRYVDSLSSSIAGIDSIVVLTLTVDSAYYQFINANICQGGVYNFRGKTLTIAGFYSDTVKNVGSCDSIIALNLTVIQPKTVPYSAYVCQGGKYNFRGQTLTASGVYYDTLQSSLGCDSLIYELTLTVDTIPGNATIYVMANGQDTLSCLGFVELYSVQNGQYILVDTATLLNYYCTFTNVIGGDYVIKVIPDSSENALPTYYGNTAFWNLATIINISCDTFFGFYIQLVSLSPMPIGNSSIGGYVGKGNGHKSISQKSVDNPAEDVTVYLQKEENSLWHTVARTLTNEDGYFVFKNIPVGKYQVILDILGLEMVDIQIIVIENDGDNVQLDDYELTEDGIKVKETLGIDNYELPITNYVVYPNPTTGKLTIRNEKSEVRNVEIYDIYGKKQFSTFNFQFSTDEIDISHLVNGMYFLKIDGKVLKVIKE